MNERRPTQRLERKLGISVALCIGAMGCSRPESELKEWSPADHNNQTQPQAGQVDTTKKRPGMPDLEKHGINDVTLATWKQNCVPCHGVIGRGDGPQGRMLRPPDFTSPIWQKNAMDPEMKLAIQKGRGRMPGFGHLPAETVDALVNLVRMLNSERAVGPDSQEGTSPPAGGPPQEQPGGTAPQTASTDERKSSPGDKAAPAPTRAPNPASTTASP